MENYELYIEAPPKRYHNYYQKGNIPFNKGKPMKEWMDGRKIKKVLKYLEIGRAKGNATMAGANRKQIVGIKDGKLIAFNSAVEASNILKAQGIAINQRNINLVCHKKIVVNGKYSYVRKKAGGFNWFFASDIEDYKDLINF